VHRAPSVITEATFARVRVVGYRPGTIGRRAPLLRAPPRRAPVLFSRRRPAGDDRVAFD